MNLLLATILLCLPVNDTGQADSTRTIIEGDLMSASEAPSTVSLKVYNYENLLTPSTIFKATTTAGHFRFEIYISSIRSLTFTIDGSAILGNDSVGTSGHLVLIEPGDSIYMTIPNKHSRLSADISFSGRGSEKQKLIRSTNQLLGRLFATWTMTAEQTPDERLDAEVQAKKLIEKNIAESGGSLTPMARRFIKCEFLAPIYYSLQDYFIGKDLRSQPAGLAYQRFQKLFPVDTFIAPDGTDLGITSLFVKRAVLDYVATNNLPPDKDILRNPTMIFPILEETYQQSPVKAKLLASYLIAQLRMRGWKEELAGLVKRYLDEFPPENNRFAAQLDILRNQIQKNLRQGADAYGFNLPDSSGTLHSSTEFHGNVVVIDFMFNGCPACAILTPKLMEIEHLFKDQEVKFLSISVDPTMEQFKKGIGKYCSPTATALFTSGKGLNHPIITHYRIQGYPTLVVVDKRGKIISARAPAPVTESRRQAFIALIQSGLNQ